MTVRRRPWRQTRRLYLRALGLTLLCAVGSYWTQIIALNGVEGLAPSVEFVSAVQDAAKARGWSVWEQFLAAPSVFALMPSDEMLHVLAATATLGCALLIFSRLATLGLLLVLLGWGSIVAVGGVFTGYQWDVFNLEVCFASLFVAATNPSTNEQDHQRSDQLGPWLLRLVLFKFMVLQGLVKWRSGDAAWDNLTALDYHFWTQPIAHSASWWAAQIPQSIDKCLVAGMYVIELIAPFGIFGPRRIRHVCASAIITLMVAIVATGNYGTFNLLTITLCLALFDDDILARFSLWRAPYSIESRVKPSANSIWSASRSFARWTVFIALVLCNLQAINSRAKLEVPVPKLVIDAASIARKLSLCAPYGAFAHMTKDRPEIEIEASIDGTHWRPYRFRYKTLDVRQSHRFAATHMPRLDWQLWFASLRRHCRNVRWYPTLLKSLLNAQPEVLALFAEAPFGNKQPRFVRSTLWDYSFTNSDERNETGHVWSRSRVDTFCPTVTMREGRLQIAEDLGQAR